MRFTEYQEMTQETAIYPRGTLKEALAYLGLALAGEAGEAAGKIKKWLRGDKDEATMRDELIDELGDALYYIAESCNRLGVDMDAVAIQNLRKLRGRKERGTLQGDGDKR